MNSNTIKFYYMEYIISTTIYLLKGTYVTISLYLVTAIFSMPLSILFAAGKSWIKKLIIYLKTLSLSIFVFIFWGLVPNPLLLLRPKEVPLRRATKKQKGCIFFSLKRWYYNIVYTYSNIQSKNTLVLFAAGKSWRK